MKKSDIVTIATVALLSAATAFFLTTAIIGHPNGGSVKVKTVDPITSSVTSPDTSVFNQNAINPTVQVIIGDGKH